MKSWENYYAGIIPVIPKPNGAKAVIDAMNKKLQYLPTILLISPDKEIIAETTMDTDLIDKALKDAGITEMDPIFDKITDTASCTDNLVSKGSWWFAHDDEGQGSKIVEEPKVSGDQMESVIHIGKYVYPSIWTWGEVAMSLPSSLDLSEASFISVTYRTNNDLVLALPMKGTPDTYGPYGRTMPASSNGEWITATYSMEQFGQPTWSALLDGLVAKDIETVAFMTSYANGIDVTIDVKDIRFLKKSTNSVIGTTNQQNQMNLFAGAGKAHLNIRESGNYTLQLISPQGRVMTILPMQEMTQGHYTVDLTEKKRASGLYIVRLRDIYGNDQCRKLQF